MKCPSFRIVAFCFAIVACILMASPVIAQGNGKGGGGNGGGGGDPPAQPPVHYTITQIGSLGGELLAFDVNADKTVVGKLVDAAGIENAFVWTSESGLQNLNDVATVMVNGQVSDSWRLASARGINSSGQIAGNAEEIANPGHWVAYRYDPATGIAELMPTFSTENHRCGEYEPINELGELVYYAPDGDVENIYVDSPIGFFEYTAPGYVYGLNNTGQVVGNLYVLELGNSPEDNAVLTDYPVDGPRPRGINDLGQLTGSFDFKGGQRAFRYEPITGLLENLDSRKNGNSYGEHINLSGDVSGSLWGKFSPGDAIPVLFTEDHGVIALDDTVDLPENDLTLWDAAVEGGARRSIESMTNRDATGFPTILVSRYFYIDGVPSRVSFLLTPKSR